MDCHSERGESSSKAKNLSSTPGEMLRSAQHDKPGTRAGASRNTSRRLSRFLLAVGFLAPLVLARLLAPSPSGHGTHVQLGFLPCTFRVVTGIPCPFCGMTTAFSWMVRGNLINALHVNPAGAILCAMLLIAALIMLLECILGKALVNTSKLRQRLRPIAIAACTTLLGSWIYLVLCT